MLACAVEADPVGMPVRDPVGIDKRFDLMQGFCQDSETRIGVLELAVAKRRGGETVDDILDRAASYLGLLGLEG